MLAGPVRRGISGLILFIISFMMTGCQHAATASPPLQPSPTYLPTRPIEISQPTATLSPESTPLENFLAALGWLNADQSFSYDSQCITLQKLEVSIPGQPLSEISSLVSITDRGGRYLTNGKPNIAITRKVDFLGSSIQDDLQVEIRFVDGQAYLQANFVKPSTDLLALPNGWLHLYGTTTAAYWSDLDDNSIASLPSELMGDAWSLIMGKTADLYQQALASSLESILQAAGSLPDGSSVQVITAVFKPEALPEVWRWVNFNKPFEKKALPKVSGTPLTIQLFLDQSGKPVMIDFKVIVDVLDLDYGGFEGTPAGTKISLHEEFWDRVKINSEATPQIVQAPKPGEMAAWPAYAGQDKSYPYRTLGEFDQRISQAADSGQMDRFWTEMSGFTAPMIFGENTIFLYHGKASQVNWPGDWDDRIRISGRQVGDEVTWLAMARFPLDARLEYQIQVDDQPPMIDPLNPNQEAGGLGAKSVLLMPGYVAPKYIQPRPEVVKGQLTENLTIESRNLGYPVNYRVYTPAGYENMSLLPVLYITDGQDFLQFGKLDVALDNLIADHKMQPIIAVFIDPRDTKSGENLREVQFLDNPKYGQFVTGELVPVIDETYRTKPDPEARAILGASYGGYFVADFALNHSDMFHLAGIFSPAIWHNPAIIDSYRQGRGLPVKFFMSTGTWSDGNYHSALLKKALEDQGYPLLYLESNEGHSYANWRGKFEQMLGFLFPYG